MSKTDSDIVIGKTKNWIANVVVDCKFCPFVEREMKRGTIQYDVLHKSDEKNVLDAVSQTFLELNRNKKIETSLLILSDCFLDFKEYLILLEKAEILLKKKKYKGVYQIASFHPKYLFAGTNENDASNYTNRSPFPMLHFLREDSVTKAIASYPDIENVPIRNVAFTKEKGLAYMQQLLKNC